MDINEPNDASLIAMQIVLQHASRLTSGQRVHLAHAIMCAILEDRKRNTKEAPEKIIIDG